LESAKKFLRHAKKNVIVKGKTLGPILLTEDDEDQKEKE
jgi:hypothetical protein